MADADEGSEGPMIRLLGELAWPEGSPSSSAILRFS